MFEGDEMDEVEKARVSRCVRGRKNGIVVTGDGGYKYMVKQFKYNAVQWAGAELFEDDETS